MLSKTDLVTSNHGLSYPYIIYIYAPTGGDSKCKNQMSGVSRSRNTLILNLFLAFKYKNNTHVSFNCVKYHT